MNTEVNERQAIIESIFCAETKIATRLWNVIEPRQVFGMGY